MGHHLYDLTEERVRRSRRAYFAMMTYVDALIGQVLDALESTGLAEDTVIVFASDHGEMLGERGMWMKESFYDWSAKVPLFIAAPGVEASRRSEVVSLVDLMPTLLEFAGVTGRCPTGQDGESLMPLLSGDAQGWKDEAICEYAGSGHPAPSRMVRRGRYKYAISHGLAPLLYDLATDPDELENIAGRPDVAVIEAELHQRLMADWDPEAVHEKILESQTRRLFLRDLTEKTPKYSNWSPVIVRDDANRYVRGRQAAFFRKAAQRFPMFESPPLDFEPDDPDLKP
jgi:choline-sulfatase